MARENKVSGDLTQEMARQLRCIAKLLALIATGDIKKQKDKVERLHSVGFRPIEIAELVGATVNTVTRTINRARSSGSVAAKGGQTETPASNGTQPS